MSNQSVDNQTKLTRRNYQPLLSRIKRDRYLGQLQERYGYPKEKAKEELDRLLSEFYGKNKRLVRYLHPRRKL
ncbi:MAG: hypothetical protein ACM3PY_08980 [Omnitrophica WOR_2 bacterium]